jgi:membrane-associated protein
MINLINFLLDFFIHIDKNLAIFIQNYGFGIYPLLFLVIFAETGLVIAPFLPGDSLLFAAGALASIGSLNVFLLFLIVAIAAILGDTINYWIGFYFGSKIFNGKYKLFKEKYYLKTKEFYDKHGGKTIILARFVPFMRTFAPFVAGIGKMHYPKFISYNIIGGIVWTFLFLFAGYFFGMIPFIKDNFSIFILLIIFVSLLPIIIAFLREKFSSRH